MININVLFEFMSMILKNPMFKKIDLSRFLKNASRIFNFLGCPKKQSRFQEDEILIFFTFLVNGHLKIYSCIFNFQGKSNNISIFKCRNILKHKSTSQFQKYFWPTFSTLNFSKLCIQHTINSILCSMIVWQWWERFQLYFFAFICKNMTTTTHSHFCCILDHAFTHTFVVPL
jgi:hypothetical protein